MQEGAPRVGRSAGVGGAKGGRRRREEGPNRGKGAERGDKHGRRRPRITHLCKSDAGSHSILIEQTERQLKLGADRPNRRSHRLPLAVAPSAFVRAARRRRRPRAASRFEPDAMSLHRSTHAKRALEPRPMRVPRPCGEEPGTPTAGKGAGRRGLARRGDSRTKRRLFTLATVQRKA